MSFCSGSFSYDGISCSSFGLMLYDVGGAGDTEDVPISSVSIVDETVGSRWKPFFYGIKHDEKLEFDITFGPSIHRIEAGQPLTRSEIAEVSSWISGHDTYKWLEFEQDDAENYMFRCIITKLDAIEYGKNIWAFRANVVCDSHFAYTRPRKYNYQISGEKEITVINESSMNGYYYPTIAFYPDNSSSLQITNVTDDNRCLSFTNIPSGVTELCVDNENGIITCNNNTNMYEHFNFKFLRLKKGKNHLRIVGNGTIKMTCIYPISIGC